MQLIDWLATAGHRLSTGAANASGTVRALQPGTNATASLFDSAGEVLTQPVELDAGGHATVYTDDPVDLAFEDSGGASAGTVPFGNVHGAESVRVENAAFTGLLASGSQGAGGVTYLDVLATRALTSFGGVDWMLKESAGGTARGLAAVIFGIQISVRDFGAKGDGLAVDTSPIQTAINRMSARGGGRVYVDPGTYLIDAQLTLPANVSLIGAGSAVSIIKQTNVTANGILVSAAGVGNNLLQGIQVTHSTTSTGIGISGSGTSKITLRDMTVPTAKFAKGVNFAACSSTSIYDSSIGCTAAGASRCLLYSTSGIGHYVTNTEFIGGAASTCVECDTSASTIAVVGCSFSAAGGTGVLLTSSDNNDLMRVIGCSGLANNVATPFAEVSPASRMLFQNGNFIDGYTVDLTSGGNHTPSPLLRGRYVRIRGTATGAAYIINALATNPITRDFDFTIEFFNNAAGAVTGWTLNAIYHVSAAIPTGDLAKTAVTFRWDSVASVAREISRAQTT